MKRGGKLLCGVTMVAVAACASNQGKLEIRARGNPVSAEPKPVPFRLAEGHSQLALGNVALALESFRKAAREDPGSVDALVGIADCYDRMGRFDLSRRNYEAALALAPADTSVLGAFAQSLQRHGNVEEAESVRLEIAARVAGSEATPAAVTHVALVPVETTPIAPEPVMPAPAQPIPQLVAPVDSGPLPVSMVADAQPLEFAIGREAMETRVILAAVKPGPASEPAPAQIAAKVAPRMMVDPTPVTLAQVKGPAIDHSVTVKLPKARPVEASAAIEPSPPVPAQIPTPKAAEPAPMIASRSAHDRAAKRSGPRIERLSMGEVALITTADALRWEPRVAERSDRSTTVRFVPIREANAKSRVRLLNAARVHRLAARTRAYLAGSGWQSVSIGDAERVRASSLILYPAGQRGTAARLSRQFGFAMAARKNVRQVTILLGRDAARLRTLRS